MLTSGSLVELGASGVEEEEDDLLEVKEDDEQMRMHWRKKKRRCPSHCQRSCRRRDFCWKN